MKIRLGVCIAALLFTQPLSAQFGEAASGAATAKPAATDWREEVAYNSGMQAVIYGYPLVKNLTVRHGMIEKPVGQADMPLHSWFHSRRASDHTDQLHSSVTADLLYSGLWYDLRQGSIVLSVPDDRGIYYSVQFMEMNSDIFAYLGTRASSGKAGKYLIAPSDWQGETPAGFAGVIRSPTPTGFLLMRVGFSDRKQLGAAHALQDGLGIAGYAGAVLNQTRDVIDPVGPSASPLPFFATLNRGLTENPPPPSHAPLLAQFAAVGIGPGKSDDFSGLDPSTRRGLKRAMVDGLALLKKVAVAGGNTRTLNHWAYGQSNWGRTAATFDFLTRSANQSFSGMQEHWIEEVVKLRAHHDGDGELLDGSKNRYAIHFTREQIPVAKAFWSVSAYNETYDLVENPIGRYSLGSVDKALKFDKHGGVTLILSADPPERKQQANWLPIPRGPFNLFLRAYLPGQDLINQSYAPPPVRKLP